MKGRPVIHVKKKRIRTTSPRRQRHPKLFALLDNLIIIGAALLISFFILEFLIINARVPSGSMMNTIEIGDRLIGNRLAYLSSAPERGDVIIFLFPDDEKELFIKRIIGLPGDTVQIRQAADDPQYADVYVNGKKLDETYLPERMLYDPAEGGKHEFTVPENEYLVLGDNRNHSNDARFWQNTYVAKDKILAKACFRYFSGSTHFLSFKWIK